LTVFVEVNLTVTDFLSTNRMSTEFLINFMAGGVSGAVAKTVSRRIGVFVLSTANGI